MSTNDELLLYYIANVNKNKISSVGLMNIVYKSS